MRRDESAPPHLDAADVAAYLDHALSAEEQARIETHLAACAPCRTELLQVRKLVRGRSPVHRWAPMAAVAAAAAVVLVVSQTGRRELQGPLLRSGDSTAAESVSRISIVFPGALADVPKDSVLFVWHRFGGAVQYRLMVANERGDVLWKQPTTDTTARLPGNVAVQAGQPYFWYVDALLADGRSATTGVTQFRVTR